MSDYDPVSRPSHYAQGREYEPIDVIEDWGLGFHLANATKYISRAGRKGGEIQDLEKAVWYLERRISQLEDEADAEAASKAREELQGEDPDDRPCYCCGVVPPDPQPDVYNVTLNDAKNISSDGLDAEAEAEHVLAGLHQLHKAGRMARNSTGSYL